MDDWWVLVFLGIGIAVGITIMMKMPSQSLPANPVVYENEDVFEWTDWEGKERKLVRHRKVKRVT